MAIPEKISHKAETAIQAIEQSSLRSAVRDDLVEAIELSRDATNGLDKEQKLQAVAENMFLLARLFALTVVEGAKPRVDSWKDVIIACKWQLVLATSIVSALLAYRPQLGALLERLIHP